MTVKEVEVAGPNVAIDFCPDCYGVWLDRDELKKLLGEKEVTDYLTKDIGTQAKSSLICPRCRNLMDIERAEQVEVDVCLKCRGVWLDQGELEGLKEVPEGGFQADETAKAEEKWEEYVFKSKNSSLNRFVDWLKKK